MPLHKDIVENAISLIQTLIQNECVNPPGNEMKSISTIHDYLTDHDIESDIYKTDKNRGNLFASIKGTGEGPSLMFGPSHVDVVPIAKSEAWEVDPFSGIIKDDHIWGRGALDMLFITATQIQAFIELHNEGFKPKGDLKLVVVSDEEAGGTFGTEWLAINQPELLQTDYAVGEAGGIPLAEDKLVVVTGEKGASWKRISFKGTPAHGSSPYKSDNAVVKAGIAAKRLASYNPPPDTQFILEMAKGFGMNPALRFLLGRRLLLPILLGQLHKKNAVMAKMLHALSHMTLSPNIIQGGTKTNIIPGEAYLDVDIRTLPGQDEQYVIKHVRKALGSLSNETDIEEPPVEGAFQSFGNASQLTIPLERAIKQAVHDYYPDCTLVPLISAGASDLRFIRQQGGQAYGFSLFDPDVKLNDLSKLGHGPNERISLKTVEYTLNAYYNLAKTLSE